MCQKEGKDLKVFMHKLLCFTDMLVSGHVLSMEFPDGSKNIPKECLTMVSKEWQKISEIKVEELEKALVTKRDRDSIFKWTTQIKESLKTGECGEDYKDFEIEFEKTA